MSLTGGARKLSLPYGGLDPSLPRDTGPSLLGFRRPSVVEEPESRGPSPDFRRPSIAALGGLDGRRPSASGAGLLDIRRPSVAGLPDFRRPSAEASRPSAGDIRRPSIAALGGLPNIRRPSVGGLPEVRRPSIAALAGLPEVPNEAGLPVHSTTTLVSTTSDGRPVFAVSLDWCGICLEPYANGNKNPLFLPCGHKFCTGCLQQTVVGYELPCPRCQEVFQARGLGLKPRDLTRDREGEGAPADPRDLRLSTVLPRQRKQEERRRRYGRCAVIFLGVLVGVILVAAAVWLGIRFATRETKQEVAQA